MTAHPRRGESNKPAEPQRVTMRDIGRLAGGVHQSTVSLALRNHPAISLATRLRVQNAAKAAGYHRNPLLDAFNARRASAVQHPTFPVIAFVANFGSAQELNSSPLHAALWRGASTAAQSLYHRTELFLVGRGGLAPERLDSVLYTRGIDCFLAAAISHSTPQIRVAWDRYCAVKVECLDWETPHFTIAADVLQGTRLAVRMARGAGHSKIGLVLDSKQTAQNDLLRAGYLIEQTLKPKSDRLSPLTIDGRPSARAVRAWVRAMHITAILTDIPDFGAVLTAGGFSVGRDIGLISLDSTLTDSAVAGIAADYERIGALAVEQVVSLSRMNQRGAASSAMVTYMPVVWRSGASLPIISGDGRAVGPATRPGNSRQRV
jgi:LacI family transcriptional regulator